MRVQNETGTGKSSWWMVNQSAKFDKPSRRRATSMETKEYEKRKGRMKKVVARDRDLGSEYDRSPISPMIDATNPYQHLALSDFRSRASSNASSYGCLSPKSPSPTSSPRSWSTSGYENSGSLGGGRIGTELGFNYESEFSSQLAKTISLGDTRNSLAHVSSPFDHHNNKMYMGPGVMTPPVGNYHPMSTNGFLPPPYTATSNSDTQSRGQYYGTTKFPSIPEEPRNLQNSAASYFHARNTQHQQLQPTAMLVTGAGGVSGGGYTTFSVPSYSNWALPHDLESFTEPVQSFDFDWEELLRHEAAIERTNLQSGMSAQTQVSHQTPITTTGSVAVGKPYANGEMK